MSPPPRLPAGATAALLVAALLWLTACSPSPDLVARDAWIRAVPPGASATAGYLVLENHGDRERRLTAVTADGIPRVEIHETTMRDGVMRMRPLDAIPIPAGEAVTLAPGGRHLMLFADTPPAAGTTVALQLRFADGTVLAIDAPVRRGGDD